jgi:allophanate hydrolase subunit 2
VLRVGPEPEAPAAPAAARALPDEPVLRVRLGPRDDWFEPAAAETLVSAAWRVSPASNRVGARLEGPRLERLADEELLSEGVATGSLQVPPSGQPILLLVDHPTTGGYPVIAVVAADDIPLAGQLAPGTSVRFAA